MGLFFGNDWQGQVKAQWLLEGQNVTAVTVLMLDFSRGCVENRGIIQLPCFNFHKNPICRRDA